MSAGITAGELYVVPLTTRQTRNPLKQTRRQAPAVTRPTVAEVDLNAIRRNLRGIRDRVGARVRIMAVVKANAYGHGAVPVSRAVEGSHADCFGVAFAEEGVALRYGGVSLPIHVFTLPSASQLLLYADHALEATICTEREARALNAVAERRRTTLPVHLKIDTGMNRIGVKPDGLERYLRVLGRLRRLEIKGVFTHLATADEKDKSFARLQLRRFDESLALLRSHGVYPDVIHAANSAAILDLPEAWYSMVRPGIMMYGCYPSAETSESVAIRPALALKTVVAQAKTIRAGETVSYGRRYTARRRTRIASIPVGYADGVFRLLTGKGVALVRGHRVPFAGTVCMDQLMLDVGQLPVVAGDEVVLIGSQRGASISAREVASAVGTIPYEVCCAVSARVPRIYRGI